MLEDIIHYNKTINHIIHIYHAQNKNKIHKIYEKKLKLHEHVLYKNVKDF